MYPHDGVDTSGLAALRALVLDRLLRTVPAYAVPALATPGPTVPGPAYALAETSTAAGRRTRTGTGTARGGRHAGAAAHARGAATTDRVTADRGTTARRPASDTDSGRMMDLVERAQDGETEAFGRLYDHYSDTVYRYIYYRVGSKATAEDLTSETFLRALRRIGTFTWQGRDFGAWLVTIARNLVADHFKSSRFRLEVTTGEMLDANEVERSPEDSVLESLSNEALLTAVRKLNPQQQECVTLRFLQGLSVAETARVMGKNEGAIKTLQYRAVRTLARLLPEDAR
ncbi:ECF subfamily RNA polymerase sigma factor, BldN family [Actinacidiphila acidipaludis]|uniref:Sigma-70 family RNA polymerase sigma factor n=1 Tax=Actinacidiphila acidipaludis TaxID=2873382 RepID=A0ABS7Q4X8_9ACTN|nr:ECF subfamily RNA polymerase sigma factor, BldN family [Streptomyces acidipaludis]MBY8878211.1 sigma-70 family RNA polymerase sigma factor [Streptomyces acidipaludis]